MAVLELSTTKWTLLLLFPVFMNVTLSILLSMVCLNVCSKD